MFTRQILWAVVPWALFLSSCSSERTELEKTHRGGCILTCPAAETPANPYRQSDVVATNEYKPFTKKLSVYGITLLGRDNVSDAFMRQVAKTVKEMFPQGPAINRALQQKTLKNLYRYRATIPIFKGEPDLASEQQWQMYHEMKRHNSVCDIIMEGVPGQTMEVVEHILHHVTDVGLHYTFPDEWGITKTSKLYHAMQEAIARNCYVSEYEPADDEVEERIALQEFGYWLITTAWDIQQRYGPEVNTEWTVRNSSELKAKLPLSYQLYEQTVRKIMAPPSLSTLDEFSNMEIVKTP